jgi:hypothetical protein
VALEDIRGLGVVVHDNKKPPAMAEELKWRMAAAKIFLLIISRSEERRMQLWIGKRPVLNATATPTGKSIESTLLSSGITLAGCCAVIRPSQSHLRAAEAALLPVEAGTVEEEAGWLLQLSWATL